MVKLNKNELLQEAKKQTEALAMLKRWMAALLLVANLSAVLGVWGIHGSALRFAAGIGGVVLAIIFWVMCGLVGYGIFKGSRNVQRLQMAAAAEK